jgi:hypothetical protein
MKLPWEILGRAGASGWVGLLLELLQGAADGMYLEEARAVGPVVLLGR